jgi:hypothetical protein
MYVGNMSSNVTIRPGYSIVGGSTSSNATGLVLHINGNSSFYEIKNCSFINFGGTATGGGIINFKNFAYSRSNPVIENVAIHCNNSTSNICFQNQYGNNSYFTDIRNVAYYAGTNTGSDFTNLKTNSNVSLKDSVIYKSGRLSQIAGTILSYRISNIRAFTTLRVFGENAVLNNLSVYNSFIRNNPSASNAPLMSVGNAYNLALFENCNIHNQSIATAPTAQSYTVNSEGATGNIIFKNCSLSGINTEVFNNLPSDRLYAVNVTYKNQNKLLNHRFNTFYTLSANYSNRNRGIASYESIATKPVYNGVYSTYPYLYYEKIPAKAAIPQRYIGYIKYDSTYANNSNNLPYITFTDELNTSSVTQTFSCSPTPNVWQKFDLTVNPIYDGDITMTFNGQTNALVGKAFLDGLTFDPICPQSRHYGFVFDSFPYRTENTLTTLTENQVSAISTINNLDYLYDASNYWSVTNPSLTSYTDLYTQNGNILNFGSKNITLSSNAINGFTYLSGSNTIILKTNSLSAGNNFNTITTTGTVTLSTQTLSNITINANVNQTIPSDLTSATINGILSYNVNSDYSILYTNTNVLTARNNGSGYVTIKKVNSTITDQTDAELRPYAATYLDLTLQSGYIAIYNNNGVQQYYTNSDQVIELPYSATGTWTYKIAKYGYKLASGSFTINSAVGGTVSIAPIYVQDIYVSDTVGNVMSYTTFYKTQQIYDYLSYYRTTSAGLSAGDLNSYISTLDIGSKNIILFDSASPAFSYDGSTFTLNSLNLSGAAITTTGTISLSGNSAISDITLTTDVLDQTPVDLTNVVINGTLAYSTNTPASITYTNTTVSTVVNDPYSAKILIKRVNSSINNATDPEIDDYAPTIINVTPNGGSVAIYNDSLTRDYFIKDVSNYTIVLPYSATGVWSYKVAKYGYNLIDESFTINSSTGATINIVPNYITDNFINELEINVAAYTDLNNANQIHDYLMYFQTLSTGIDYGDLEFETFGTITFANSVALSANASSMVSISGSTLVLKSTDLTDDIILVSPGTITQHAGNTISNGVKIRATNLDSEIYFNTVDSITFFPDETDRDNNVNGNITLNNVSIYRFKYGSTVSGITFTNNIYARITVGGATLLIKSPISLGSNTIDFGVTGNLQTLNNNLKIVNAGVQKASILVPHTTNI